MCRPWVSRGTRLTIYLALPSSSFPGPNPLNHLHMTKCGLRFSRDKIPRQRRTAAKGQKTAPKNLPLDFRRQGQWIASALYLMARPMRKIGPAAQIFRTSAFWLKVQSERENGRFARERATQSAVASGRQAGRKSVRHRQCQS